MAPRHRQNALKTTHLILSDLHFSIFHFGLTLFPLHEVMSTLIFEAIDVKKCDMGVEEDVVSLAEEQWSKF